MMIFKVFSIEFFAPQAEINNAHAFPPITVLRIFREGAGTGIINYNPFRQGSSQARSWQAMGTLS
jgi:hypothetical protein